MDILEAKSIIVDAKRSFAEKFRAVKVIVDADNVQPADLLDCLDVEGVSAELAAMKLHILTGRKRDNGPIGVYLDRQDWEEYLKVT